MVDSDDPESNGVCTFVGIMTVSFFVFAFVNGVIHTLWTTPSESAASVLAFTNTMMPIILMVTLLFPEQRLSQDIVVQSLWLFSVGLLA